MAVTYFKKAISLMKGLGETPEGRKALARSYQDLGKAWLEAGDLGQAQEVLESALSLVPDDARCQHYLGLVMKGPGATTRSPSSISRARCSGSPTTPISWVTWDNLYQLKGDPDLALKALRKAISLNPGRARFYEILAGLMQSQRKYDEAAEALRKASVLEPRQADRFHASLGALWAEQGQWEKAASEYKQALTLNERQLGAHEGLARALEEMGRDSRGGRTARAGPWGPCRWMTRTPVGFVSRSSDSATSDAETHVR